MVTAVVTSINSSLRRDLGLQLFGSSVIAQNGVHLHIVRGVLECVQRERAGETVDRGLLRSVIHMFQDLQVHAAHATLLCACVPCVYMCLSVCPSVCA